MIGIEDLERLSIELTERDINVDDWAAERGISEETMQQLASSFMGTFREMMDRATMEMIKEQMEKMVEERDEDDLGFGVAHMSMRPIVKAAMVFAFMFGWETCREYGNSNETLA